MAKTKTAQKRKDSVSLQLKKEEILKDKIAAGEWEALPYVEAFWERTPEGQLVAVQEAIENRMNQLRAILPRLLARHQRAAYIQILDYIHELERKSDNLTVGFFERIGQRKLTKESKGKNYY